MFVATFSLMGRHKKPATTTIRVDAGLAEDLEIISDYLSDTTNAEVTIGSLVSEWVKAQVAKHRQKAIDHRIDRLRKMKESN